MRDDGPEREWLRLLEREWRLRGAHRRLPGPQRLRLSEPFFCRAFPVCILNSTLSVDDEQCPDEHACCGPVKSGPLSILDVCAFELEYMLGTDGLAELRTMAADREKDLSDQPADKKPVPA